MGRLDINSEGLLLITNSGDWAQKMMRSNIKRIYKVRAYGQITQKSIENMIKILEKGITIENQAYAPVIVKALENKNTTKYGKNTWFEVVLKEGKNREIRKIFSYFNLQVNRLIRTNYGDFSLGDLKKDQIISSKS